MASRREREPEATPTRRRPATTPDAREKQLTALAYDAVEKRIAAGTASAQELVHFLKIGSAREELERERLARENELLAAKTEALAAKDRLEQLLSEAMVAMRDYRGLEPLEMVDDDED